LPEPAASHKIHRNKFDILPDVPAMIERKKIKAFVGEVAQQFHPRRVVLFGSYAYGRPNADSDVDLLVIMPHKGHSAIQAAEIRKRIHAGFPVDLIVRSPREIRRRLAMDDFFITEILERGKTLYEYQHA
jgi:predicted nucleotidyltransferase